MFEWDEAKNILNMAKHGISFEEACLIFDGPIFSKIDNRFEYGEERTLSIGLIENIVAVVVVHTERNGNIRIISARIANRQERNRFYEYLKKSA